jgi:hypothetical protein
MVRGKKENSKMRRAVVLTVLAAAAALPMYAFQATEEGRGDASATIAGKKIAIDYGRPSLKGRDMLGQAPVGTAWRMGSGDPTHLATEGGLTFGGTTVPAGKYILKATRVKEDAWALNVMKGAEKLVDVPLTTAPLPESVETFTIKITPDDKDKSGGLLSLEWGKTALRAPFRVK